MIELKFPGLTYQQIADDLSSANKASSTASSRRPRPHACLTQRRPRAFAAAALR